MTTKSASLVTSAPSCKCRSVIRPPTCSVTVTDSEPPLFPISSKYKGTSCFWAFATVTSGAGSICGPAACGFARLHPLAVSCHSSNGMKYENVYFKLIRTSPIFITHELRRLFPLVFQDSSIKTGSKPPCFVPDNLPDRTHKSGNDLARRSSQTLCTDLEVP